LILTKGVIEGIRLALMNVPIVIAAYNRDLSLQRLLNSVAAAFYLCPVKLIISVDGGGTGRVIDIAKEFDWQYGEKEVIHHPVNLGLRRHILSCGELAKDYDGIILLEDDLFVSPEFYKYALAAADFYRQCTDICGISLYSCCFNETAWLPFFPLVDGSDTFFMQLPCSWGQLWLREQWMEFSKWYFMTETNISDSDIDLPYNICSWPETSWKKYFAKYMVEYDKYFVYPYNSYSTNFADSGQNHKGTDLYQVPLVRSHSSEYYFVQFSDSLVKYDMYCELLPECLKLMSSALVNYDFEVDIHGAKHLAHIQKPWILTTKKCISYEKSYARKLIPPELNVVNSIVGDEIHLAGIAQVNVITDFNSYVLGKATEVDEQKYYYRTDDVHHPLLFWVQNRLKQLEDDNVSLRVREDTYLAAIDRLHAVESSRSWRATAPLRKLFNALRRLRRKFVVH